MIDPAEPQSINANSYSFETIDYTDYTIDNTLTFDTENSYVVFAEEFIAPFQSYYGGSNLSRMSEARFDLYAGSRYDTSEDIKGFSGKGSGSLFGGLLKNIGVSDSSIFSSAASFMRSNSSLYCYEFHFAFKGSVRDQDFTFLVKQNPDKLV